MKLLLYDVRLKINQILEGLREEGERILVR